MKANAKPLKRETVAPAAGEAANAPSIPSEKELQEMIAQAAYYRAEKRGFAGGAEAEDWLQAEAEVLAKMRAQQPRA
jgi:hypothetical protein